MKHCSPRLTMLWSDLTASYTNFASWQSQLYNTDVTFSESLGFRDKALKNFQQNEFVMTALPTPFTPASDDC